MDEMTMCKEKCIVQQKPQGIITRLPLHISSQCILVFQQLQLLAAVCSKALKPTAQHQTMYEVSV